MLPILVLFYIGTVGGVPLNITQNVTLPATVTSTPLNVTQNATLSVKGSGDALQGTDPETVEGILDDHFVDEGDILLLEDRNAEIMSVWPGTSIPYVITDSVAGREATIHAAFKMISDKTCIRFHERTTEPNYLTIQGGRGCASYVGCKGGDQPVYYAPSCSVGNLCHELMHALGLHHEHTRPDRDQFIDVKWDNIRAGSKKNFKVKHGDTLNLPYDYNSIMHYGQYSFSAAKNPTIVPRQDVMQLGQRKHLSHLDTDKLKRLYRCG